MNFMFDFVIIINQNIIKIRDAKIIEIFTKNVIDVILKRDRFVV